MDTWSRGEAGALPRGQARLFYSATDGTFDLLGVPSGNCPRAPCCPAGPQQGCLNPWALRGSDGKCMAPPRCRCGTRSAPGAAASSSSILESWQHGGVTYTPGSLAWRLPPEASEVDSQLELVGAGVS